MSESANEPKTADQINRPQTGQIDVPPPQGAPPPAAAVVVAGTKNEREVALEEELAEERRRAAEAAALVKQRETDIAYLQDQNRQLKEIPGAPSPKPRRLAPGTFFEVEAD